jgi:hypothetical protein
MGRLHTHQEKHRVVIRISGKKSLKNIWISTTTIGYFVGRNLRAIRKYNRSGKNASIRLR